MSEEAKAVQEVAKTAGQAIDAAIGLGGFIERIFNGSVIANFTGLPADWLKFYRAERLVELQKKFDASCAEKGIDPTQTKPVLTKFGIPLLENAALEEDDSIQKKWANMLANAMNPQNNQYIGRNFVTILSEMNITDVKIFDVISKEFYNIARTNKLEEYLFSREKLSIALSLSERDIEVSLRNLLRLGCIKPGVMLDNGIRFGGSPLTVYKDTELFNITELGLDFFKAVN